MATMLSVIWSTSSISGGISKIFLQERMRGSKDAQARSSCNTSPNALTLEIDPRKKTHFGNRTSWKAAVMSKRSGGTQTSGHTGVYLSMLAKGQKHKAQLEPKPMRDGGRCNSSTAQNRPTEAPTLCFREQPRSLSQIAPTRAGKPVRLPSNLKHEWRVEKPQVLSQVYWEPASS